MFHSAPDEGSENIRLRYLLSIASARRTLLLTQAYFVPDDLFIDTLAKTALLGVRVEVIMPGDKTDTPHVRQASRARWATLLQAGVKLYEYSPPTCTPRS